MKSLSRSYVWWPGLEAAVEECVWSCDQCQSCCKSPAQAPLHPWEWPERPWAHVHADYVRKFMGNLLLIDAHSKWMEVHIVAGATSASTMEKMRVTFATHGLPKTLVTDNGLVFTSAEFWEFLKRNGIRHVTSAPYHPTSNGLAECAVQVFKEGMREGNGRNTQNEGGTIPPEVPDHPTLGDGTTPSRASHGSLTAVAARSVAPGSQYVRACAAELGASKGNT